MNACVPSEQVVTALVVVIVLAAILGATLYALWQELACLPEVGGLYRRLMRGSRETPADDAIAVNAARLRCQRRVESSANTVRRATVRIRSV